MKKQPQANADAEAVALLGSIETKRPPTWVDRLSDHAQSVCRAVHRNRGKQSAKQAAIALQQWLKEQDEPIAVTIDTIRSWLGTPLAED